MKIIIDVNHPGHVHLFKNFAKKAEAKGWKILFTAKDKEVTVDLIKVYGFKYKKLGKHYTSKIGKLYSFFSHIIGLIWTALFFRADMFLSHGSVPASWASFVLMRKNIAFEDTGNMEQIKLYKPFAHVIITAETFNRDFGNKQIKYKGYHENAYLHPSNFIADKSIYHSLGIGAGEKYFLLRFVSWGATHDVGQSGLLDQTKREIISMLSNHGKVFISSESKLPDDLKKYQIKIAPQDMHSALAFADIYIGEGATMASECTMLGTPSIYINTLAPFYIKELHDAGLLFHFRNSEGVVEKVSELLLIQDLKKGWIEKSQKVLSNRIDLTAFTFWFVQNFPESIRIWKENPEMQHKFLT
jgi:uncharacterized protein